MTDPAVTALLANAVRDADINYGLDFEVALERLHVIAGRLFTQYRAIKLTGSPEAIEQARTAFIDAQSREKGLRLHDYDAIRAILGG